MADSLRRDSITHGYGTDQSSLLRYFPFCYYEDKEAEQAKTEKKIACLIIDNELRILNKLLSLLLKRDLQFLGPGRSTASKRRGVAPPSTYRSVVVLDLIAGTAALYSTGKLARITALTDQASGLDTIGKP